jgi:hypothetical protein
MSTNWPTAPWIAPSPKHRLNKSHHSRGNIVTNTFGSFGNQCLASGFEPDLSKMHPFDPVMGMPLGIQWLYAFLQDEDGLIFGQGIPWGTEA